jgi:NADH:ubiquinone oxidoreductase subunit 5 (subunit L)/multisubunit Na+/H+ antiporter MnhA subunit
VFERAQHSTIASAHLFGVPGTAWLYFAWILGLASAFMTATYMTRMMLYTFHGPNRSGTEEQKHLSEAPWIMTGPLVVLGLLTVAGGWLNLPEFAGFLARSADWIIGSSQWLANRPRALSQVRRRFRTERSTRSLDSPY